MLFSRRFLRIFILLAAVLAAFPCATAAVRAYKGAIVIDAASGKVLFADNADEISPPASMTKLMTFAVLQDKIASGALRLDTPVTVNAAESHIGGTRVWLKEKEVFPVEELIYALMIKSANDAAYALATTAAGTPQAFVELMNAKARELGMTRTKFRSPHGLPPTDRRIADGDLTTPRDFAILARHLLLTTDVLKYTSVVKRDFGLPQRAKAVLMVNHNHLLSHVEGMDGLKTGFTNGAGFCLSATAQRGGRRIIAVMMDSPSAKIRDQRMAELIEKYFPMIPADSHFKGYTPPPAAASPVSSAPLSPAEKAAAEEEDDSPAAVKFTLPGAAKKN